jgi:exopolysaccharide biosynthesis polyprenyl glycosylphosphotransferase
VAWLIIFYLFDLYRGKNLRVTPSSSQTFILAIFASVLASIILFYLFPNLFKLTPKTNLVIFAAIFGLLDFGLRSLLGKLFIAGGWRNQILLIGDSPAFKEISDYLRENPQIGYAVVEQIKEVEGVSAENLEKEIKEISRKVRPNTLVVQSNLKNNPETAKAIYRLLSSEISVLDLVSFYETLFEKVPLDELEENWFIEKMITGRKIYDNAKRVVDLVLGIILFIVLMPFMILSAISIKLTSRGPAVFAQKRMGKNEKPFTLYKFRTMKNGHEGPLWTTDSDKRVTFIGKFLRRTHLDEFPQLYNIIKGDISFIGPRAERMELAEYYGKLPRYEIRHIIKPGLTGWAQLNYKPSASLEEAKEKLQYDIYYIKNRSLVLDFLILLKTIKYLFVSNGKS